jgi:Phosphatidylglycerophosphatase A and related proteins
MEIKESSDELNPSVATAEVSLARPAVSHSFKDYLALAIATCGVGYLPLAPGTWGAIVGVGLHLIWIFLTRKFLETDFVTSREAGHWFPMGIYFLCVAFTLLLLFCLTLAGNWAATRVEKLSGRKDASIVVIDEVAGQLITLTFIPFLFSSYWVFLLAGFLLFRVFDIWKPYPIRRLEALESGLGVMADDVLAGIYAGVVLSLLIAIYFLILGGL